jgi:hypothetical protein
VEITLDGKLTHSVLHPSVLVGTYTPPGVGAIPVQIPVVVDASGSFIVAAGGGSVNSTMWVDIVPNPQVFYIRRETISATNVVTIDFELADGTIVALSPLVIARLVAYESKLQTVQVKGGTGVSTNVAVGTSSVPVLLVNANRISYNIQNTSGSRVYFAFGAAATINGSFLDNGDNMTGTDSTAINAICAASGAATLSVNEYT